MNVFDFITLQECEAIVNSVATQGDFELEATHNKKYSFRLSSGKASLGNKRICRKSFERRCGMNFTHTCRKCIYLKLTYAKPNKEWTCMKRNKHKAFDQTIFDNFCRDFESKECEQ